MVVAEGGAILDVLCKRSIYSIEQSSNYRITCVQYSQKNFMRIIGNYNEQNFWEILERIIGKISSIINRRRLRLIYRIENIFIVEILWSTLNITSGEAAALRPTVALIIYTLATYVIIYCSFHYVSFHTKGKYVAIDLIYEIYNLYQRLT